MKIKNIKELYPKGTRIKNLSMSDQYPIPPDTEGTVAFVDDIGTIHVNWDNGRNLGLIVGEDDFTVIQPSDQTYETLPVNLKIKAPLVRKDFLKPQDHKVKIAIKVSKKEFEDLLIDPMKDRVYIAKHKDEMYLDDNNINNSILVYTDNKDDGVLIVSEGFKYARYQSYVTNVHDLLETNTYVNEENNRYSKIKVLVVEPQARPYVAIIDNDLEMLQSMVDGPIELLPLSDTAEIVCNEEGKLRNLPANRRITNDVLAGRFIIVGNHGGEHFTSITSEDINKYQQQFSEIEMIDQSEVRENIRYDIVF